MQQFKDIKSNNKLYILNSADVILEEGRVTSIIPRTEMDPKNYQQRYVVDISIEVEGKTQTYTVPENSSIAYADKVAISTSKKCFLPELENIIASTQIAISTIDKQRENLKKAKQLYEELNPEYREKQENEKRFKSIEGSVAEVSGSVKELKSMVSNLLKEIKK